MARIVLTAKAGKKAINGEKLAGVSSQAWPRWIEIDVYSRDEGGFAVHRVGKSVVYHREDTPCATVSGAPSGRPVTVDNLPDDAVPCQVCRPLAPEVLGDLSDHGEKPVIRLEVDRPVLAVFENAARAQDFIVTVRDRYTGEPGTHVSPPVAELIGKMREASPEWAALPWPEATIINPEGTVKQKHRAG